MTIVFLDLPSFRKTLINNITYNIETSRINLSVLDSNMQYTVDFLADRDYVIPGFKRVEITPEMKFELLGAVKKIELKLLLLKESS